MANYINFILLKWNQTFAAARIISCFPFCWYTSNSCRYFKHQHSTFFPLIYRFQLNNVQKRHCICCGWLLRQYGLPHIRFHDLRHSCASLMVMNGVSMKQVQEWLGHSTFSTTADIYAHLDYKSKEGSAGVIAELLETKK